MGELGQLIFRADFLNSIFRVTTPLMFAGMGAVISDVAGVPNIALEGLMLIAAFAGMYFSYLSGSALAGLAMAVLAAVILLKRTSLGFHIRAVGEKKEAAESVGIHVERTQMTALLLSGLMCGFGGAFMSMGYVSWFSRDMIAGRGWIALAAEAMGRQTPLGTAATSVLFGAADAFSNAVATLGLPSDLVKTIPYCVTLIGLAFFSVRTYRKHLKKQ